MLSRFSRVWLSATLWTVALQTPLFTGFSRQEYWSGLPSTPPGDLPDPGIEPVFFMSPAWASRFFTTSATWDSLLLPRYAVLLYFQALTVPSPPNAFPCLTNLYSFSISFSLWWFILCQLNWIMGCLFVKHESVSRMWKSPSPSRPQILGSMDGSLRVTAGQWLQGFTVWDRCQDVEGREDPAVDWWPRTLQLVFKT